MSTDVMMARIAEVSPRFKVRIAGVFYLLTFVTGSLALFVRGRLGVTAGLIAGVFYIAVTIIFYDIFKPVSWSLSLFAAFISLVGYVIGPLSRFHLVPFHINSLVFFGFYNPLIGYLIFRSTVLPQILGVLMAFGGLGWLSLLSPPLGYRLLLYVAAFGLLMAVALIVWLLVFGVNERRWKERDCMRITF